MIQNTNYGASKTYVNTKVDKLTTSGLKAYTHDGATQGEIDVSNTYTPATLALRDANGRMQAADPASGATDKTLVTANWISQSGNSSPNNLLHKIGTENFTGYKEDQNDSIGIYGSQSHGFICKSRWFASTTTSYNRSIPSFIFKGNDNVEIARLELVSNEGVFQIRARIKNHDNTEKIVVLARGDN